MGGLDAHLQHTHLTYLPTYLHMYLPTYLPTLPTDCMHILDVTRVPWKPLSNNLCRPVVWVLQLSTYVCTCRVHVGTHPQVQYGYRMQPAPCSCNMHAPTGTGSSTGLVDFITHIPHTCLRVWWLRVDVPVWVVPGCRLTACLLPAACFSTVLYVQCKRSAPPFFWLIPFQPPGI